MKNIYKLASLILDFLFPRDAPIILIENMSTEEVLKKIPRAGEIDGIERSEIKALFDYRNELAKQAIWQIKYRKNKKILETFCSLFYEYILDEVADVAIFRDFRNPILIPIPSSRERLKERGYNQCELIAEKLMQIDSGKNFTVLKNTLEKIKDSPSQTSIKNRLKRLKNLNGCFSIENPEKIKNADIILIDDVVTTGATMSEAKKTLLNAGAKKVICFALAH